MNYYFRMNETPDSDDYGEPFGVYRFEDREDTVITEWWNPSTHEWEDRPSMIRMSGIGGDEDFKEVNESEAKAFIEKMGGEYDGEEALDQDEQSLEPEEKKPQLGLDKEEIAIKRPAQSRPGMGLEGEEVEAEDSLAILENYFQGEEAEGDLMAPSEMVSENVSAGNTQETWFELAKTVMARQPEDVQQKIADVENKLRQAKSALSADRKVEERPVERHGVHYGQEGRPGKKGGSQKGYKHAKGGEDWSKSESAPGTYEKVSWNTGEVLGAVFQEDPQNPGVFGIEFLKKAEHRMTMVPYARLTFDDADLAIAAGNAYLEQGDSIFENALEGETAREMIEGEEEGKEEESPQEVATLPEGAKGWKIDKEVDAEGVYTKEGKDKENEYIALFYKNPDPQGEEDQFVLDLSYLGEDADGGAHLYFSDEESAIAAGDLYLKKGNEVLAEPFENEVIVGQREIDLETQVSVSGEVSEVSEGDSIEIPEGSIDLGWAESDDDLTVEQEEEAQRIYDEHFGDDYTEEVNLEGARKKALSLWLDDHREVTSYLRDENYKETMSDDDSIAIEKSIEELDDLLERGKSPVDMVVYRGGSARDWKPGDEFTDQSFVSTTLTSIQAVDFAFRDNREDGAVYRMVIPKGTPGLATDAVTETGWDEDEWILPRRTIFRIVGVGEQVVWHHGRAEKVPLYEVEIIRND